MLWNEDYYEISELQIAKKRIKVAKAAYRKDNEKRKSLPAICGRISGNSSKIIGAAILYSDLNVCVN